VSDEHNGPVSLEERRKKRAQDAIMAELKPAQAIAEQMHAARQQRIDCIATAFDLSEPYNRRVLSVLLLASEEFEEPPFKWSLDMGWMWRGYCLSYGVASSIRGSIGNPNNPRYPDWTKQAAKVIAEAGDDWEDYLSKRDYESLQSLLSVPDREHAALQEIVNGLALFSDYAMKSHRYMCLVQAIIYACEEEKDA
jgi:hypothetical protein